MSDSPDSEHFDLVVIGAGPAGEKGAAQAAYYGKRVCIVERAPKPGGAMVNTGTVPSKTLRETARYFTGFRQRGVYAVDLRVKSGITVGDFMQRERNVIESEWEQIDENIQRHHIATIQGTARFIDAHTLEVTRYGTITRRLTADAFLVATGARPEPPVGYALDDEVIVDSDSLLMLQRIPASMIVIGGGVIGCEYACTFAALGTRVTVINERARLISHLDHDVSDALRRSMTARLNVTVYGDTAIRSVDLHGRRAAVTLRDGTIISADVVLVASGRLGNATSLGLEAIGVRTDARGFLQVDANHRTAVPNIYAAGDVVGFPALASSGMEQARAAVCHAFDLRDDRAVSCVVPYTVWTIPELAIVGESEEALLARGARFEVGRASFRHSARGQILGDVDGFVKLLFDPESRRILGVTIVGEGACELIHVGMTVMALEGTLDFLTRAAFALPSLGETYRHAANDGLQQAQRKAERHRLRTPVHAEPATDARG